MLALYSVVITFTPVEATVLATALRTFTQSALAEPEQKTLARAYTSSIESHGMLALQGCESIRSAHDIFSYISSEPNTLRLEGEALCNQVNMLLMPVPNAIETEYETVDAKKLV